MKINKINENGIDIAVISSEDLLITDVQSALDLIATVNYEVACNRIILNKSLICEEFFDLKTRMAGEILQKFINYQFKIAIVGDFSVYTSESLADFIYECNQGKDIFFLSDENQAIEKFKCK